MHRFALSRKVPFASFAISRAQDRAIFTLPSSAYTCNSNESADCFTTASSKDGTADGQRHIHQLWLCVSLKQWSSSSTVPLSVAIYHKNVFIQVYRTVDCNGWEWMRGCGMEWKYWDSLSRRGQLRCCTRNGKKRREEKSHLLLLRKEGRMERKLGGRCRGRDKRSALSHQLVEVYSGRRWGTLLKQSQVTSQSVGSSEYSTIMFATWWLPSIPISINSR